MSKICVIKTEEYSCPDSRCFFRPSIRYPEYIFEKDIAEEENHVYDMVRQGLRLQGLDNKNYGTSKWNPFGGLIKPGDCVLIKSNIGREAFWNHFFYSSGFL